MTIDESLKKASTVFDSADIHTSRLDSLILLEMAIGKPRAYFLAHPDQTLTKIQQRKFDRLVKERSQHIPIAYLTGKQEFYGLDFKVAKDVLIPRPETESMVELAIKLVPKNGTMIDVGTGSGCVAICVGVNRPDLAFSGSDISKKALRVAKQNAKTHNVKVRFLKRDLLDKVNGQFDLICANLPYIRSDIKLMKAATYEPSVAIFGGLDGLEIYRRFFSQVGSHLKPSSCVLIEALPDQVKLLGTIASKHNLKIRQHQGLALLLRAH